MTETEMVADPVVAAVDRIRTRRVHAGRIADRLFHGVTGGFALLVLSLLAAVLVSLAIGAAPAFRQAGFGFFISTAWDPVSNDFGALVPIFGTVVTAVIALVLAVPISFGIALFLTQLAPPWLSRPVSTAIELLAAVPSIIYGMWGLFVFAPFYAATVQPAAQSLLGDSPWVGALFQGPPLGIGMSTAGIILAIMIIPFITAIMRDVFMTVPPKLKESAYALGCTTWEVTTAVVLPYTRAGTAGGIMLGLGRALGETMAVTFVIGNAHDLSAALFMPGTTISSTIANEFTEAYGGTYSAALLALGLTLFLITVIVLALARLMLLRLERQSGGRRHV